MCKASVALMDVALPGLKTYSRLKLCPATRTEHFDLNSFETMFAFEVV